MKALKIQKPGHAEVLDVPIPKLRTPDHVLVRPVAVATNPTDWKHIEWTETHPTVGCDYSGVVHELGSNVTNLKKGDPVWGVVHGSNAVENEDGAFGEYLVSKAAVVQKKPENLSFEDAATLGVGITTVGQGLYQTLGLPWPSAVAKEPQKTEGEKPWILIYGGSSAMGAMGIQFARLSGFRVVTTCSPRNNEYVKSLGADAVFDYSAPDVAEQIRKFTDDKLYYVWDCIGEGSSYAIGTAALSSDSSPADSPTGKLNYASILAPPEVPPREYVEIRWTLGYTAMGEAFTMKGQEWPAQPSHYEFIIEWLKEVEPLLAEGKVKTHRVDLREGGIEGILDGLADLKSGKVSGVKLVYRIQDP
ncbi:chaperonin 10-like protein [Lophiotrema nucula]|uniref:Chaperonin 10-like protein n=1 Tax=Lophiotrema nucula TaxID=690887 RepID=A0A6A5YKJ8_9PLEO|nr:chaperonin 10-like protein [Lophiotrema nucula]